MSFLWASFRGACVAREPGIHTPKHRGYGFRARRIRSRVYPRSALYDAHIGNSQCAVAPRNDAPSDFEIRNRRTGSREPVAKARREALPGLRRMVSSKLLARVSCEVSAGPKSASWFNNSLKRSGGAH